MGNLAGNRRCTASIFQSQIRPDYAASVTGRYAMKGKNSNFIVLNPDGTFFLLDNGMSIDGNYKLQGDTMTLTSPGFGGRLQQCRFIGDTIRDEQGRVWEKQAESQKPASQLTIDQIIQNGYGETTG